MTQIRQIYTDCKELRQVILSEAKNLPNTQGDASLRSA